MKQNDFFISKKCTVPPLPLFTLILTGCSVLIFIGCEFKPNFSAQNGLMDVAGSTPAATIMGPKCNSCHTYPLHDVNHNYHLMSANVNRNNLGQPELNAVTTCSDCHFNSIQHFTYLHHDTIWVNAAGDTISAHTLPTDLIGKIDSYSRWRPVPYLHVDTSRGEALATEIDSLIFRQARLGQMVEWITSAAHNNGVVDVAFTPNNVTKPQFLKTAYRPQDLSCSTITCHNQRDPSYRFMSPRLGLSNCPSLDGHDPTCQGEIPVPAKQAVAK
jgi:hypothetical protein